MDCMWHVSFLTMLQTSANNVYFEWTQIFFHPRLRELLHRRVNYKIKTYLGMFGAPTWKPVVLVSSDQCVDLLKRTGVPFKKRLQEKIHSAICSHPCVWFLFVSWKSETCHLNCPLIPNMKPQLGTLCRRLVRANFAQPSNSTVKYSDAQGRTRFKGGKQLKATQEYPPAFGREAFWRHCQYLSLYIYTLFICIYFTYIYIYRLTLSIRWDGPLCK